MKTMIAGILTLAAIILFALAATLAERQPVGLDGLVGAKWGILTMIAAVVCAIAGLCCTLFAVFNEKTVLSWICVAIYLIAILIIVAGIIRGGAKKVQEQRPPNTLTTLNTVDGKVFLTDLELLPENQQNDYKPTGNGDYFLRCTIISENNPKIYDEYSYDLHIIPDRDRFKIEAMERVSILYVFTKGEMLRTYGTPANKWLFAGYSTDSSNMYAQIFAYYLRTCK